MIDAVNLLATGAASVLLFLVMWAFRRHALSTEDTALTDLIAGIFWLAAAYLFRDLWWGGVRWLLGPEAFRALYGGGIWPNLIFNGIVIVATWRLLRGFWLMIPEEDRSHYAVLTAAFYPRRLRMRISRKETDE